MQFLATINRDSFVHKMGRARGLGKISVAGVEFLWEGAIRAYQSNFIPDPSKELRQHPAVRLEGFEVTAGVIAEDKVLFEPDEPESLEPEPKPKRRKGKAAPEPV